MEHEEIMQEPAYSPFVLEFLAVAHKYCVFIEDIHKYTPDLSTLATDQNICIVNQEHTFKKKVNLSH
jgi:hypothetical protein